MKLNIPRGIVYHKVSDDIIAILTVLYKNIEQESVVNDFEKKLAEYVGRKYSLAFPFARTAIYTALKSQNIPKGSEILMPPITIKGILDVVLSLGLHPVFVDIDLDTLCFDLDKIQSAITPKTKAILITYLFGIVPDVGKMLDICKGSDLFVIEDFSQCLNGVYNNKKVGSFGDVGIYSASSIKTLDTYGGGLLVCDDDKLYKKLYNFQFELQSPSRLNLVYKIITDLVRNIATTRIAFHFIIFPLLKIVSKVKPGSVIKHTGGRDQEMIKSLPKHWFERYTSFQANIGLKYLSTIQNSDQERVKNVEHLKSNMPLVKFPNGTPNSTNVYWQLVAFFKNPIAMQKSMHKMGVDTSTTSLEKISSLSGYAYHGETPNADYLYNNGLFIPAYPGLSSKDLQNISRVVSTGVKEENENCDNW
jgi:perosamine synthetase